MKILSGHLTQHDRRVLAYMLAHSLTTASSKRKTYELQSTEPGRAVLVKRHNETDDWGRVVQRLFKAEVMI